MNAHPNITEFDDNRCDDHPHSRYGWLPTWGASLLFHVVLLLALTLMFTSITVGVQQAEHLADVQIAFKKQDGDQTVYEAADDTDAGEEESASSGPQDNISDATASGLSQFLESAETPEIIDIGSQLRGLMPQVGNQTALPGVGSMLDDAGKLNGGALGGLGKGRVRFLGAEGEGRSFTYVFDRSGSMMGAPIRVAKAELVQSLQSLQSNQQFQVIFYNHETLVFSPGHLNLATPKNLREAASFTSRVTADGGTDHMAALKTALRLRTDVIFFMTDADQPPMTAADLEEVRRNAAGTQIHTIHFGSGPPLAQENFLMKLARQNQGEYYYIDINKLKR